MPSRESFKNSFALVAGLTGWFAVIVQFVILMENKTASTGETIIRFFSFFTILSNIAVAISFTAVLAPPASWLSKQFNRPGTQSAVTVYIIVVGVVYNIILRSIWHPQGMQRIIDEILHSVMPFVMLIYWLRFTDKSQLRLSQAIRWLGFPLVYTLFTTIRGEISGYYPYPFLNVPVIGYPRAVFNGVLLLAFFTLLNLLLIFVAKQITKRGALSA
jgi:hypothetical protein